jgi:flavin reductase (DIM6/NTAB) family NADH-FMN oxidoreductase RutF
MVSPYTQRSVVVGPVGLVLTEWQGKRNAMTVSFFGEAAHHPTTLWVSIEQSSYTHELVQASGRFTLVVLDDTQSPIARTCGSVSGRTADKCRGLKLYHGAEDALYMEGAFASVACRLRSARPLGEHTLFIADILAGEFESRRRIRRHLLTTDLV